MCGVTFTLSAAIFNNVNGEELKVVIISVIFWPFFFLLIGFFHIWENKLERWYTAKLEKVKSWRANRKEDKLFYTNHLDDKFERSGIKFDENGDIKR